MTLIRRQQFYDWTHAETGAMKVSDHWVRSPAVNVSRDFSRSIAVTLATGGTS